MAHATWTLKTELPSGNGGLVRHITEQIRQAIVRGELQPGDQLPASRQLASDLQVARGTVTTAVEILVAEGLLESRMGAGSFVSAEAARCPANTGRIADQIFPMPAIQTTPDIDRNENVRVNFRPCKPSMENFPLARWRRCVATAANSRPSGNYGDPRGDPQLREVIADYLRRARGLTVSTEQVLISNGSVHAMHLLAHLYLDSHSEVVFEEPGYPLARQMFQSTGASILPCRVDSDGLVIDELPANPKKVGFVYVTPSHQFPTGNRLSLGRRRALIDWAEKHGVIVIEDDYDGDFRYDVPPLAPMAALPNNCVVYCGTFSKTLFPGIRLGYTVAPAPLIDAIAAYRAIAEYAPNSITQAALQGFMANGDYDRHVHRMRRLYAAKRRVLASTLSEYCDIGELSGLDSGLHGLVRLNAPSSAKKLADKARKSGILVPTVSRYAMSQSFADDGLILGYSALSPEDIADGVRGIFS